MTGRSNNLNPCQIKSASPKEGGNYTCSPQVATFKLPTLNLNWQLWEVLNWQTMRRQITIACDASEVSVLWGRGGHSKNSQNPGIAKKGGGQEGSDPWYSVQRPTEWSLNCLLSVLWGLYECSLCALGPETQAEFLFLFSESSLMVLWVLSGCSIRALWVFSECSLSVLWEMIKSGRFLKLEAKSIWITGDCTGHSAHLNHAGWSKNKNISILQKKISIQNQYVPGGREASGRAERLDLEGGQAASSSHHPPLPASPHRQLALLSPQTLSSSIFHNPLLPPLPVLRVLPLLVPSKLFSLHQACWWTRWTRW